MKNLEFLSDLIKILIPATAVMYAMYLVVKSFLNKEFEKRLVDMKIKNTETILPIRLQAYERMALFLERISPGNLLVRLNDPSFNVGQLQQVLIQEIREEYNHNLSQQIYMSDQAWKLINGAKDEIMQLINNTAKELPGDARGLDLAKRMFDELMKREEDPVNMALVFLKSEIQKVF